MPGNDSARSDQKPQPKRRHSRHRPKPHAAPPGPPPAESSAPRPGPSQPRPPRQQQPGPGQSGPPGNSRRPSNRPSRPQPQQAAVGAPLFESVDLATWTSVQPSSLPVTPAQVVAPDSHLKVFTYNTWSSSPTHSPFQAHSLLRTLSYASRDGVSLIALQEVTLEFAALVRRQDWAKRDWVVTNVADYLTAAGEPSKGGGGRGGSQGGARPKEGGKEAVMLMVRKGLVGRGSGVRLVRMGVPRDDRGRAIVVFDLHQNNRLVLRLCTSHFTALPLNAQFRRRQYQQTLDQLFAQPRPPLQLILADTNAANEQELTPFRLFTDAFTLSPVCPPPPPNTATGRAATEAFNLHQERLFAAGPTFGHLYPWVPGAPRKKPRKPRRLDRVWVRGAAEVVGYGERGGQEPVRECEGGGRMRDGEGRDGWMWESDHVGVEVTLRIGPGIA